MELEVMPPESAYRDSGIDPEEWEAMETLLAMRNGMSLRHKLKVLGRECRNPAVGRTITASMWVRLDELGNPEIIDESKDRWESHKVVSSRWCPDGIRIASPETGSFNQSGGLHSLYSAVVDYNLSARYTQPAILRGIEYAEYGVEEGHTNLWGWSDHNYDACPVCVEFAPVIRKIEEAIEANKEKERQVKEDNTIRAVGCPEGFDFYDTIFIPYSKDDNKLAGPEPQKVRRGYYGNYTDDAMMTLNKHFEKVKTKRGKPKDVF